MRLFFCLFWFIFFLHWLCDVFRIDFVTLRFGFFFIRIRFIMIITYVDQAKDPFLIGFDFLCVFDQFFILEGLPVFRVELYNFINILMIFLSKITKISHILEIDLIDRLREVFL